MDTAEELWSLGDYASIGDLWASVARETVAGLDVTGTRLLDVACGTGAASLEAARRGAVVTGLDITTSLLDVARARADKAGLTVRWVHADMTAMPEQDGVYDRVVSVFGSMFAPDPAAMAAELVRVCRPGGVVAVVAWTRESVFARFNATLKPFLPETAEQGADVALWGSADGVHRLFAGLPVAITAERRTVALGWPSLDACLDTFTTQAPPLVAPRAAIDASGRWPDALAALRELFAECGTRRDGRFVMDVPYLRSVLSRD